MTSITNFPSQSIADNLKTTTKLQGAIKTLERSRPILAICVYHKKEDLITIPQFIKSIYKNCRFYLRKHCESDVYELVLYAVPE